MIIGWTEDGLGELMGYRVSAITQRLVAALTQVAGIYSLRQGLSCVTIRPARHPAEYGEVLPSLSSSNPHTLGFLLFSVVLLSPLVPHEHLQWSPSECLWATLFSSKFA